MGDWGGRVSAVRADGQPCSASQRRLDHALQQVLLARAKAARDETLIDAARAALAETEQDLGNDERMQRIVGRLGLPHEQRAFLWTVVACSVDGRIVPQLEELGGPTARRGLSVALYSLLTPLDAGVSERLINWLASDNPLIVIGLLRGANEDFSPAARPYAASARLASYLAGDDTAPAALTVVSVPEHVLHDERQSAVVKQLANILARGADAVVVVEGLRGAGRLTACACAIATPVVALDLRHVATAELAEALRVLQRECLLRDLIPAIANIDVLAGDARADDRQRVVNAIEQMVGPVIVTTTALEIELGSRRGLVRVRWDVADTSVRIALWTHAVRSLGGTVDDDLTPLAHRFAVGPSAIRHAAESVHLLAAGSAKVTAAALASGLRHNIAERLTGLARRVDVTQTWQDLVISDDIDSGVRALISRIRHSHQVLDKWGYRSKIARGTGTAALFSGPPGTGKTMVAGLIARDLDLELYQVDLSKVVSKWVGETEKNLARVFDAAEEGHGLLLFDEADALFAQRSSDVQGANDRYANLEVNYLLQRVEAFGGITILTTNLETAIDSALKRRLAAHIKFELPDEHERALLWKRIATTGSAPLARDVDFDRLARDFPKMSGANIRNAALAAAFVAAGDDASAITQEHLYRAARAEYRSMGHILVDAVASVTRSRSSL